MLDERTNVIFLTLKKAALDVLGPDSPELTLDMRLGDAAGVDSLDLVEIMMILEEEHQLTFDADDLSGLETVSDAVALIASRLAA